MTPRTMLLAALALLSLAAPASAAQPLPDLPDAATWTANGSVRAMASVGDTTYIAGNFSYLGPATGSGFLLHPGTGARDTSPRIVGAVSDSTPDGAGGFYVLGQLRAIAGQPVGDLAHVLADGSLDPSFVAPEFETNNFLDVMELKAIALSGGRLYVAGKFEQVDDQPRGSLVALDPATGAVLEPAFDLRDGGGPARVSALAAGPQESVFVGGNFSTLGGDPYPNLLRLEKNGDVSGGFAGSEPNGEVTALAVHDGNLYVTGSFDKLGSSPGGRLRRYSTVGIIDPDWVPAPDGSVRALSAAGEKVFLVGDFTKVGLFARPGAAAVSTLDEGAVTAWNPSPGGSVESSAFTFMWDVLADGPDVHVAGNFTSAGGEARDAFATVDATQGKARALSVSVGGSAMTLSKVGERIFVGGSFSAIDGVRRRRLAAIGADGKATAWNPGADFAVASIEASPDGQSLYVAGEFKEAGGAPHNYFAALSAATGQALPVDLGLDHAVRDMVLSSDGTRVYLAGDFTHVAGTPRSYLAAVDTTAWTALDWNPGPDDKVARLALAPDGGTIHATGFFDHVGSQDPQPARMGFAALDTTSAAATDLVIAAAGGGISSVLPTATGVYLAGSFSSIAGVARRAFAAVGPDGAPLAFDPKVQANDGLVLAGSGAGTVILGGQFVNLDTVERRYLAEVDAITASPTAWHPRLSQTVTALHVAGRQLWVGGGGDRGLLPGGSLHRYVRPADPAGPAPGGAPGAGEIDSTAPRILSARLSRKRFKARKGTRLALTLSEPARVRLTLRRERPGRRVGKACRKPTRSNARRKRCVRLVEAATLEQTVQSRATITIRRRKLAAGRYRLSIRATDAAGNRSAVSVLRLRIVKG
jgi:trimeric autotransporter adhesin